MLLFRPSTHPIISRIGGAAMVAAAVGFFIAKHEWWEHDCYDVGEIPGCEVPETYLGVTWFVSVLVCVMAVAVALAQRENGWLVGILRTLNYLVGIVVMLGWIASGIWGMTLLPVVVGAVGAAILVAMWVLLGRKEGQRRNRAA
jgi:hypothetical protein